MALRKNPLVSSFSLPKADLDSSFASRAEFPLGKEHCHVCLKPFSLGRKRRVCSKCGQPVCKADSVGSHSVCTCSQCRARLVYEKVAAMAKPLLDKRAAKLDLLLRSQTTAQHKIKELKESTSITENLHASASEQFQNKLLQSSQALERAKQERKGLEDEFAELQQQCVQLTRSESERKTEVAELELARSDLAEEVQSTLQNIDSLEASRKDLLTKLISVLQVKQLKGLLCRRCWSRVQARGNRILHRYAPMGTCLEAKACGNCRAF